MWRERLDPVHDRHREIEHDEVGTFRAHHLDAALSVAGIADDVELTVRLERDAQQQPDVRGVVDQDDADGRIAVAPRSLPHLPLPSG